MLPKKLRESLFEKTSVKTMRYVTAVPIRSASGLTRRTYDMIGEDFFVNGSLNSHSRVPELFAGTWMGGREMVLVTDRLDRTTKEAMGAALSYINDCPYCADMLVSLVHGSGDHRSAVSILRESEEGIEDPLLRSRVAWVRRIHGADQEHDLPTPFSEEQLPEAIGTLFALHYVNRFSHVVMDGSPVADTLKNAALRLFGYELRETTERPIKAGRALQLLPLAPLPEDMGWSQPNARIADALSRWGGAVERESSKVVSERVRRLVHERLQAWRGEAKPISRNWVEDEIEGLSGEDYHIAKLILVVAMASYQFDDSLAEGVLTERRDEQKLIRVLALAAFSGARRMAELMSQRIERAPLDAGGQRCAQLMCG